MRSPRFFIISLLVLSMGVSLVFSSTKRQAVKVKSTEDYWSEAGLGPAALKDLLENSTCASSEKYFMACANALLVVANRFNMTLTTQGQLMPVDANVSADMSSEKKQLE
ncbi:MAG TPA: hypothetical protein VN132_04395, partial [Bdellovibrio sp.]|nr:hypothetical protein [Bdellovibrio sp.]